MESSASGAPEFSVGSVLSRTWSTLWKNPGIFLGVSFVSLLIPEIITRLAGYALESYGAVSRNTAFAVSMCGSFSALVCMVLFSGMITYAVFQIFMGERASITESMKRAVSRFPALFVSLLAEMAAIALVPAVLLIVGVLIPYFRSPVGAWPLVIIIFIIFTPVTLSLLIIWCVATPACVVERAGPFKSLGRSRFLTKGHRFGIFGMLILLMIINGILGALNHFIFMKLLGNGIAGSLFAIFIYTVPTAFTYVVYTVAYYSLRVTKENLASASLADIFA